VADDLDNQPLVSIELFTGAGGLALGTAAAGFHHLAVVELERNACDTLQLNRKLVIPDIHEDIKPVDVHAVNFSYYVNSLDLLAAGVPCQPFSLAGKHRGHRDHRNLFPEVFRAVCQARPKALLIENVKGLTRKSFAPYFEYIQLCLSRPCDAPRDGETWEAHKVRLLSEGHLPPADGLSYWVKPHLVNCADFGVPQKRERVLIVGFRSDLGVEWTAPSPTHSEDALLYAQWVDGSYWKEHSLKQPRVPEHLRKRVEKLRLAESPPPHKRWRTVRDAIGDLPAPFELREHPEIPNHFSNPGARAYPGHTGSPWDEPAKTLKAGDHGVPGGENMLRHSNGQVRYFTIREAARIQTFPDTYVFAGAWTECLRQLGNAVPVEAARVFGQEISRRLSEKTWAEAAKLVSEARRTGEGDYAAVA
jgi:DNA (cytosine-5)-methyltransferase 1